MEKQQLMFSATCGVAVAGAGAALAISGMFDWSLFWVGGAITAVTFATRIGERVAARSAPLPARVRGRKQRSE